MITKKDIPFSLLKTVETIVQPNLDIIQFKREDNTYYCFVETDNNSKNFFKVIIDGTKRITNYNKEKYTIELKPRDQTSAKAGILQVTLQELETQLQIWVKLIRDIHDTPSVHDDNFTKHYTDFYFNEFKIVDEDANVAPFNPDQQEFVELYLDSLNTAIQNANEVEDTIKLELTNQIQTLKQGLPVTTKNQVMKGISKVFGKLFKVSKQLAKEVVAEAKKSLIKKLIELGIEYGPKILEAFTRHHT